MADAVYNSFKLDTWTGAVVPSVDTFKLMLVTATYVPDVDAHSKRSHVTNEVVGTGYVAGGATIAGTTVTQDNTNNRAVWDFNDVVWSASTITARGAVLYKSRGGVASADELVAYFDFGSNITSTAGNFTAQLAAAGALHNN